MAKQCVSMSFEVAELEGAARGARVLVELVATESVPNIGEERRVLLAAVASLHVLEARLALLGAVLRGDVDVARLAASHNVVTGSDKADDDVRLPMPVVGVSTKGRSRR